MGADFYNPEDAKQIVDYYLAALNAKLLKNIKNEASANRAYLEKQLNNTNDPIMKEKISNMIAFEIEKYMLVSSKAFDVLEKPVVPVNRIKPKRRVMVIISLFLGFCVSLLSIACIRLFLRIKHAQDSQNK